MIPHLEAARKIADEIRSGRWRRVAVFGHDDPDGVTSAAIVARLLRARHIEVETRLPPEFQLRESDIAALATPPDAIFCLDKGTLEAYRAFANAVEDRDFVIIDHHPIVGAAPLERAIWSGERVSGSVLCRELARAASSPDSERNRAAADLDLFLALLGLRADWAFNPLATPAPALDEIAASARERFPNLIAPRARRPTWFEPSESNRTTLLSEIAELAFAVSGGGFQYFHADRDPDLANPYPPDFLLEEMLALEQETAALGEIATLDEYIALHRDPSRIRRMLGHYRADWRKAIDAMRSARRWLDIPGGIIALYDGSAIPLMPMAGSVRIHEISREENRDGALFMIVTRPDGSIHVSARATAPFLDCGRICREIAEKFNEREPGSSSGGGHKVAAECVIKLPIEAREIPDLIRKKL